MHNPSLSVYAWSSTVLNSTTSTNTPPLTGIFVAREHLAIHPLRHPPVAPRLKYQRCREGRKDKTKETYIGVVAIERYVPLLYSPCNHSHRHAYPQRHHNRLTALWPLFRVLLNIAASAYDPLPFTSLVDGGSRCAYHPISS